jgi:hydroxyethylthiazole kinase
MNSTPPVENYWQIAQEIRRSAPLVQNITNLVVQSDTAAAIAAVGATQVTLHTPEEAADAAHLCAALALNPGTLDSAWLECARKALEVAGAEHKRWVMDPVAAGLTGYRTAVARELLQRGPTVLKANPSELLALSGLARGGRAADSIHDVDEAGDAAAELARTHGCVVVVTGASDLITDGKLVVRLGNGRPLLGQMIGSGCMLTSVIGCFLAVEATPLDAAVAGVAYFTVAGEIACEHARGPGSLKAHLIDALYSLQGDEFRRRLRMLAD